MKEDEIPKKALATAGTALVIITALLVGIPYAVSETSVETKTVQYDTSVNLTAETNKTGNLSLGVAAGGQGLHYGDLPLATTQEARKKLELNAPVKSLVMIDSSGNISRKLDYQQKHYFEGYKQILIGLKSEDAGYYTGEVKLKILKPENDIGRKWIELRHSLPF